jgi:hypothetical protein
MADSIPVWLQCPALTETEHAALKAVYAGEATPGQQRLTLQVITNKFARSHDLLYIPGSFDGSAFMNGRAFVGQKILKYLNLPIGKLPDEV